MDFHEEQLAVIGLLLRMRVQESQQTLHELRDDLQMGKLRC